MKKKETIPILGLRHTHIFRNILQSFILCMKTFSTIHGPLSRTKMSHDVAVFKIMV